MWKSTEKIAQKDGMNLVQKLLKKKQRAIFVERGISQKCCACRQPILENGLIRSKRLLVFGCGHVTHSSCAIDHATTRLSQKFSTDSETPTLRRSISACSSGNGERCPACDRSSG